MQCQEVGLKAEVILGPRRNSGLFVKAILGPAFVKAILGPVNRTQHVLLNG